MRPWNGWLLVMVAVVGFARCCAAQTAQEFLDEFTAISEDRAGVVIDSPENGWDAYESLLVVFAAIHQDHGVTGADSSLGVDLLLGEELDESETQMARAALQALGDPANVRLDEALETFGEFDSFVRRAAPREFSMMGGPTVHMRQDMGTARALARYLRLRAVAASEAGDERAALTAVRQIADLAEPTLQQPIMLARLVGVAIRALALDEVRRLASRTDDPMFLAELGELVESMREDQPELHALRGERVFALASLSTMPLNNAIKAREAQSMGEAFDAVIEWASAPAPLRVGPPPVPAEGIKNPVEPDIVGLLMPAVDRYIEAERKVRDECLIAGAVIGVHRWMLENGGPPESLDQLVPDFVSAEALEPFTAGRATYVPKADEESGAPFTADLKTDQSEDVAPRRGSERRGR